MNRERLVRRLMRVGFTRAEAEHEADKIMRYFEEHPEERNNPRLRVVVEPETEKEEDPFSNSLFLLTLFTVGLIGLATLIDLLGRWFRRRHKKREVQEWLI